MLVAFLLTSYPVVERFKVFRHSTLDLQRAIDMTQSMISCRVGASLDPEGVSSALKNLSEGGIVHSFLSAMSD